MFFPFKNRKKPSVVQQIFSVKSQASGIAHALYNFPHTQLTYQVVLMIVTGVSVSLFHSRTRLACSARPAFSVYTVPEHRKLTH